jgi:hypothetical protein
MLLAIMLCYSCSSCNGIKEGKTDKGTGSEANESKGQFSITDDDYSLIKDDVVVALNMSKEDFVKVSGIDDFIETYQMMELDGKKYRVIEYEYEGLSIKFSNINWDKEGRTEDSMVIASIRTKNNQWETLRGVKVTDNVDVIKSYYAIRVI